MDLSDEILRSAEDLLKRRSTLEETFCFRISSDLKEEEYSIEKNKNILIIRGGTASAVMFGAGRLIREPDFRGKSSPDKSFRGIYFATHFGNWYDNAPESEIDLYLEDLVIWGCNCIKIWFDRHQFRNIMSPAAQKKLKNLRAILKKSASLGMKTFLTSLANEAYADSPAELRADWVGMKNGYKRANLSGHYHVELCPSRPGSIDLLLHWHEEMFDAFSGIPIHYYGISCYDQGGCTCADCAPYGANGYWKIIPRLSDLIRSKSPETKIVVNTWRFNVFTSGEWEFLRAHQDLYEKYANLIFVDNYDLENLRKVPFDIPAIGFTDISMGKQLPWGGYGTNPCPTFLDEFRLEKRLSGNSAYSEGIYEDMNKVMLLGTEWDADCTTWEMIRKYAAFYFGEKTQEPVLEAIRLMEQNMNHSAEVEQDKQKYCAYFTDQIDPEKPWRMYYDTPDLDKERAGKCLELIKKAESFMDQEKKCSWRWRIVRLRAEIDVALVNGIDPDEAMFELQKIYCCTESTKPCLIPPARSSWEKIISEHKQSRV